MPIYTPAGNVTTTVANVYVSTGNTAVMFLTLCNYSVGNAIANVYAVPSGGTAGNLNCILNNIEIASGDTYQLYAGNERLLLGNNDSIQANANADNTISVVCSWTPY